MKVDEMARGGGWPVQAWKQQKELSSNHRHSPDEEERLSRRPLNVWMSAPMMFIGNMEEEEEGQDFRKGILAQVTRNIYETVVKCSSYMA